MLVALNKHVLLQPTETTKQKWHGFQPWGNHGASSTAPRFTPPTLTSKPYQKQRLTHLCRYTNPDVQWAYKTVYFRHKDQSKQS